MVPIRLTDLLLRLAEADTFRPLWSDDVLAEVERNLPKLGVTPQKAAQRVRRMRSAFPDANVTGYQSLVPSMENDPKDRHVLAAAVRANAEVIVTANLGTSRPQRCGPTTSLPCRPTTSFSTNSTFIRCPQSSVSTNS